MNKITLLTIITIFFALSCSSPIKPTDYSKEAIDEKYPYWNVQLRGFFARVDSDKSVVITAEEKRYALEGLALMRTMVNTQEFADAILAGKFRSAVTASVDGGAYNITKDQYYTNKRVLEVLQNASYKTAYTKGLHTDDTAYANVGESSYVFYGYKDNISRGDYIQMPNKNWKTEFAYGAPVVFMALIFHEHSHNLGFTHTSESDDTPYALQGIVQNLGYRYVPGGDLYEKYQKMYEEIKAYYLTEYKMWLTEDTISTPSKN